MLTLCIALFNPFLVAILVSELVGFGTEFFECTNLWDKITKFFDIFPQTFFALFMASPDNLTASIFR